MLKLLWTILKLAAFAALVLVAAHWVRWDGRTVSDHVESRLSQAERLPLISQAKQWTEAKVSKAPEAPAARSKAKGAPSKKSLPPAEVTEDESEELRALLGTEQ